MSDPREVVRAEGIYKSYRMPHKTVDVLRDASLRVLADERVAVVGRSGAGKSTLLHLLGGLDRPDEGEVRVEGRVVYDLTRRERAALRAGRIGFVFQSYHLLPEMDVVENVMLPGMAARMPRREARARAVTLLERVGLGDRLSHTPLELSGGEQQRAALARAMVNAPPLILADEPTGNLDAGTGNQVLDLLFELSRQEGHALVMVTHSPETAARCDRVLQLIEGQLV